MRNFVAIPEGEGRMEALETNLKLAVLEMMSCRNDYSYGGEIDWPQMQSLADSLNMSPVTDECSYHRRYIDENAPIAKDLGFYEGLEAPEPEVTVTPIEGGEK